jgi:hypothetical protein
MYKVFLKWRYSSGIFYDFDSSVYLLNFIYPFNTSFIYYLITPNYFGKNLLPGLKRLSFGSQKCGENQVPLKKSSHHSSLTITKKKKVGPA